jgi:hypothetical protein
MTEATYTLTRDQVDEISLDLVEVAAMVEVLDAATMEQAFEMKHLNNYVCILEEKVEVAIKRFEQAIKNPKKT